MPLIIIPDQISRLIAFLHNSVFPPLLSASEEAAALSRLAQGDEDARNMLIEHNLIHHTESGLQHGLQRHRDRQRAHGLKEVIVRLHHAISRLCLFLL